MVQKYNENKNSKKYKGKCGCFTSQMKALQYAVTHKLKNIVILEDDAIFDGKKMPKLPKDEPTLFGAVLQHPDDWNKTKKFKKNNADKIIKNFKKGVNLIDYDKFRFTGAFCIYYPDYTCCQNILNHIYDSGKPLKHFDIYLGENRLVKYLVYPSIYTHDDTLTGSSIAGGYEGVIKNYKKI